MIKAKNFYIETEDITNLEWIFFLLETLREQLSESSCNLISIKRKKNELDIKIESEYDEVENEDEDEDSDQEQLSNVEGVLTFPLDTPELKREAHILGLNFLYGATRDTPRIVIWRSDILFLARFLLNFYSITEKLESPFEVDLDNIISKRFMKHLLIKNIEGELGGSSIMYLTSSGFSIGKEYNKVGFYYKASSELDYLSSDKIEFNLGEEETTRFVERMMCLDFSFTMSSYNFDGLEGRAKSTVLRFIKGLEVDYEEENKD